MPTEAPHERWFAALALVLGPLSGCTTGPGPAPATQTVRPADSATAAVAAPSSGLPVLPPSDSGRTLAHLENRTGSWQGDLGAAADTGSLFITVVCVGGGQIVVTHSDTSSGEGSATSTCDGRQAANLDEAVSRGRVTVAVEPDGDQRWSALIVRAPDIDR